VTLLGIVVPCYNEQEVLPETVSRLTTLLDHLSSAGKVEPHSAIWLVDDGSKDNTWRLIQEASARDSRIHGVKLSRNYGHQNALLAGLEVAEGDAIVSIDADLQDDITVIEKMVDLYAAGIDVVSGVRQSRQTDTPFKRASAQLYYRFLARMGANIIYNHGDYRLLSRRALDALNQYREVNLFLRGIIPQLGFATATVPYDRAERFAGKSKYPLGKMIGFALNGVTSFSVVPLRLIAMVGILVCAFSVAMIGWVLFGALVMHNVVPGWASSVIPIYLLGGVQLFSIGIIGEYIGKMYLETKSRPRYFIQERSSSATDFDQAGLLASRQNSL
jgi:glycosyltransferase involved in cell wall biosynthesis